MPNDPLLSATAQPDVARPVHQVKAQNIIDNDHISNSTGQSSALQGLGEKLQRPLRLAYFPPGVFFLLNYRYFNMQVLSMGDNMDIWLIDSAKLREEQISNPSLAWLMPQKGFWGENEVKMQ